MRARGDQRQRRARHRACRHRARGRRWRLRASHSRGWSSARTSSSEARPPLAITGIETARASASGRFEIEPGEHAVARDVGIDDGRDAGVLEAAGKVERGHLARLGPAFDRDLAVARIDADGDAAGKVARRLAHQRRVAHRRGAEDHAVDALLQPGDDGVEIADAAAELHRDVDRREDRLDRCVVHRPAFEGAVEIDHMQPLEALRPRSSAPAPPDRSLNTVACVHLALAEPDALSVFQVDGGNVGSDAEERDVEDRVRKPVDAVLSELGRVVDGCLVEVET